MHIDEHTLLLMTKQHIAEAERRAGQMWALRSARPARPSLRIRLGTVLVRLGQWIMRRHPLAPGGAIATPKAQP